MADAAMNRILHPNRVEGDAPESGFTGVAACEKTGVEVVSAHRASAELTDGDGGAVDALHATSRR